MTPEDVQAIREWSATGQWPRGTDVDETLIALCDALEAAWAERADPQHDALFLDRDYWRERAERAEAGLQTHDCCTRHSCARKLAEAQACIEGDRPMSQCTPDITSPLVQWQAIPIAEWERIEAVVTAAKAWVAYITEGSGADNGKFDRLVGAVRALDAAAGGTSKGSEANHIRAAIEGDNQ
jgi:hypothetical protein